ncbi:MAG: NADH-quinone oxidoreductase subunit L [Pseudomonadota bacterium]
MYTLIVLLPLLGAILAMPVGKAMGARATEALTTSFLWLAAILSWIAFLQVGFNHQDLPPVVIAKWFASGTFEADWSIRRDTLTVVMLVVVNTVSAIVHTYSIGYMHDDPHRSRFFAYLSLFTFAMLMLVTADNFMQLFFGWEGVGLASYLLIGFWFKKNSANGAAMKAFIVNRVGDFGFALGIMGVYLAFGSVEFDVVFAQVPEMAGKTWSFIGMELDIVTTLAVLLFIGAMGKSAQFLLHTWLPDAMEGPTPVSALIHAATMVTAGVFLVVRCGVFFDNAPAAAALVTYVGAITAFFAASVGLLQDDIKKVIAYSTCSQLGYMFVAAGVGAYDAAMFHLYTHAFFKALLFLGAGAVIHGMHHEQDMKKMGGIAQMLPLTYIFMLIGTVAITGVGIPGVHIGTAGFISKDAIIERAFAAGADGAAGAMFAFWLTVIAAVFTSFYSWRLIFLTFHGRPRAPESVMRDAHDAPPVMSLPLWPLAIGAIFAGMVFYSPFIGYDKAKFWNGSISNIAAYEDKTTASDVLNAAEAARLAAETSSGEEAAAASGLQDEEHHGDGAPGAEAGVDTPGETTSDETTHSGAPHAEDEDGHGEAAHGDNHGGGHHVPTWVLFAPLVAMLVGLFFAITYYWRDAPRPGALRPGGLIHDFLKNKWYVDEVYDVLFVKPAQALGRLLWKGGDGFIIDRFGPNGVAAAVISGAKRIVKIQSGYLYHYAFVMIVGIAILVTLALVRAGGQ